MNQEGEIKYLVNVINLQAETITAYKTISFLVQRVEAMENMIKSLTKPEEPITVENNK